MKIIKYIIPILVATLFVSGIVWAAQAFPGALNRWIDGEIYTAADVNALEATIGITGSASTTSLTYKINDRPTYAYASSTYFQLSVYYSTTTDGLTEGSTNFYWTTTTNDYWGSQRAHTAITWSANGFAITTDGVGDTQLAYNTGQHLTDTSNATFNGLTITTGINAATSSITSATSTNLYITNLGINSEYFTDLTGTELQNSSGVLSFDTDYADTFDFYSGSFIEDASSTISSDGSTVTLAIEKNPTGNLRVKFSDGFYEIITSPTTTSLTAGSNASPQVNYAYILKSTMQLTISTTGFPSSGEYAPIGHYLVQSAASVQEDGVIIDHNYEEHIGDDDDQYGHLTDINAWIRKQHATWVSGVGFSSSVNGNVLISTTAGVVRQLHENVFPAIATSSEVYVVNHPTTAYTTTTDLSDQTSDSDGDTLVNRRYSVVIWGSIADNESNAKIFVNLPSGSYLNNTDAINDPNGYTNYIIPDVYKGDGFLIARLVLRNAAGTFTKIQTDDLRGELPSITAGGTLLATTIFPDNTFQIFDETDNTKIIAFQASGITTGNTRTLTVQDSDGTIAYLDSAMTGTLDGFEGTILYNTTSTQMASDDFGDYSCAGTDASCTLDADVIAAAEMADADHGDGSWTSGVLSIENLSIASHATGSIIYYSGEASDQWTHLAIGSAGQVLEVSATGIPEWDTDDTGAFATTTADYWGSQRAGDDISWSSGFDLDDPLTITGLTVTYSTTTGTLAIPTSATLSLSQSAQFGYDTTTGQLRIHDGTADRVLATGLKAFTIGPVENPVASDQIPNHFKAPFGMTITQVDCLLDPADTTGIEIDIDIFEADGNGDSTTTVFNIPLTVKNTNTATTTFANAVIDSGDWVGSFYSNASGTASWISCTVKYRITAD